MQQNYLHEFFFLGNPMKNDNCFNILYKKILINKYISCEFVDLFGDIIIIGLPIGLM